MPYHPSNVSSSRRLPPSSSSSSSNMSSKLQMISTPPPPPLNSVYTKGTHGAVKTKPQQQPQQRSSALPQHLQSHQHHYQQAQRRTPRSEERHRTQQPKHNTSISSRQHQQQQQQQQQHYNTTRSSFTTTATTTTRTTRRRRSHSPTTMTTTTTTTPSSTATTRSLRGAYNVVLATSTSTPTSTATPSQPQPPPQPPSFLESRGTISDHGSVSSLGSLSRRTPPIVRDDSSSQRSNRSVTFGGIITTTTTTSSSTNQQNENNSINSNKPIFQTLQDLHKQHLRTTRRIIDELNRPHNSYERRVAAISVACETFDHTDESLHNIELHHGAAQALAKLLMHTNRDDEIRMLCAALEMVLRGNAKSVQTAMEKMTQQQQLPSLLSHLLRLLQRCERGQLKYAVVCAISIHRIVLYWSRCPRLRATLARQVGLLDVLTNKSSSSSRNKSKNNDSPTSSPSDYSQHDECRIARIRTIANLARCDENKVLLLEEGNHQVLEYTVRVAYKDVLEDVRHYAAIALMEFASAAANQKVMADSEATLSALVTLIFNEEKNAGTREYAITAIQNLAFAKTNRVRLVTFKDGMVLKALIDALSTDPDDKARRRAAGALTNLACEETSGLIGSYKGLLNSLGMVTLKDKNKEVQTRAALALTKIANGITVHMSCHDTLLDALVTASLSDVATSISAVLRVKARAVENRESMARHGGVLDTLCDICMSDKSAIADRDNAVRTIMHLVNEDKNRKIMCNKSILEALVASADYKDPDLSDARDSAIRALERLGTEYSNRPVMARHKGLLVTVSKAVEREAQWEEEGKKTEYGYLAKPLLMSLLLAM